MTSEAAQYRQLIIDSQQPHKTCYWGLGFLFSPDTMKEDCIACVAKRQMKSIANGFDHATTSPSPAPDADDYVAWCTYERDENNEADIRIVLCDSNTKGAFKVYRRPTPDKGEAPAWQGIDRRWNLDQRDDGVYFCRGTHHRSHDCEWERLTVEITQSLKPS